MKNRETVNSKEDPSGQRNLVAFRLDQQTYALPIEPIVQIVEMVTITPIPHVNAAVAGVITVHGVVVPVVNLRRHFGLPEAALGLHTPIILVQTGEQMVGLIADEVIDVLGLPAARVAQLADILPQGLGEAPILRGLAHVDENTVLLLDLEHLFLPHQARALAQVVAALPDATTSEGLDTASGEGPSEVTIEEAAKDVEAAVVAALLDEPV
jgi:purine-binding chemotaxis protein CheW